MSKAASCGGRNRFNSAIGMDRSASQMKRYSPAAASMPRRTARPLPGSASRRTWTPGCERAKDSATAAVRSWLPFSITQMSYV